jgi:hypothetical protein
MAGMVRAIAALALIILLSACLGPSERDANKALRETLRADPAFQLIPPAVRSSMHEDIPVMTSMTSPEEGPNGYSGREPAPAVMDVQTLLTARDQKLRGAGWTLAGGECYLLTDPDHRSIIGLWTKRIKGRWAFFEFGLFRSDLIYGIHIRAVSDNAGRRTGDFMPGLRPGHLGCGQ